MQTCMVPKWIRSRIYPSITEKFSLNYSLGAYGRELRYNIVICFTIVV